MLVRRALKRRLWSTDMPTGLPGAVATPNPGAPGGTITVTPPAGGGFGAGAGAVNVGGAVAVVTSWSNSQVRFTAPGAAGTLHVTLTGRNGTTYVVTVTTQ